MGTTTTRTGDPGNNFVEQSTGDTPCVVSMDMNAKGQAQLSIRLAYPSASELRTHVADELWAAIEQAKLALSNAGIPLAGQSSGVGSASSASSASSATEGK